MARILIVEDEDRIVSFLSKGLEANGHSTMAVGDGITAAAVARSEDFDLMILDLGLPGQDGFAVLAEIRRRGERLPVIVLTARDQTTDTVAGFEAGADDYVTKPFRFEELLARVRARLRDQGSAEATILEAGDCLLDLRRRTASIGDRMVELSAREFALAETLFPPPRTGPVPRAAAVDGLGLRLRARPRTSSRSTSGISARSSVRASSRPSAAWATA